VHIFVTSLRPCRHIAVAVVVFLMGGQANMSAGEEG